MTRRKTFEALAYTRTVNRLKRIEKLMQQIGYDWFDSEVHSLSDAVDRILVPALQDFREELDETWKDHVAEAGTHD